MTYYNENDTSCCACPILGDEEKQKNNLYECEMSFSGYITIKIEILLGHS